MHDGYGAHWCETGSSFVRQSFRYGFLRLSTTLGSVGTTHIRCGSIMPPSWEKERMRTNSAWPWRYQHYPRLKFQAGLEAGR